MQLPIWLDALRRSDSAETRDEYISVVEHAASWMEAFRRSASASLILPWVCAGQHWGLAAQAAFAAKSAESCPAFWLNSACSRAPVKCWTENGRVLT